MEITINETAYILRFGIGFVRELNKSLGLTKNGANFGMGLTRALPGLESYDPSVLADIIYAATKNKANKSRPGLAEVEDYLDDAADVEQIFETVQTEVAESNSVKAAVKKLQG